MTTSPNRSVDATLQVLIGRLPPATTDFLKVSLEPHGMGVEIEPDPSKVVAFSLEKSFDCILVGADPLTLGELFVRGSAKVPVIALVEEGSGQARVRALEAGAQECLKAPFGIGELVGRIRALAGSGPHSCPERVDPAWPEDFEYARDLRLVDRSDRSVSLTRGEGAILNFLLASPGRVLSASDFALRLWGPGRVDQAVRAERLVANLRRKIDRGHPHRVIQGSGSDGYFLALRRNAEGTGLPGVDRPGALDPSLEP